MIQTGVPIWPRRLRALQMNAVVCEEISKRYGIGDGGCTKRDGDDVLELSFAWAEVLFYLQGMSTLTFRRCRQLTSWSTTLVRTERIARDAIPTLIRRVIL